MIKSDRGSVSVFVFITVLFFLIVTVGVYISNSSLLKTQLQADKKIKEIYEEGTENVDQVYDATMQEITESTAGYVQEGLICHLDGINNTGYGHGTTKKSWSNLVNNSNITATIDGDVTWEDKGLLLNGNKLLITNKNDMQLQEVTVEIIYKSNTSDSVLLYNSGMDIKLNSSKITAKIANNEINNESEEAQSDKSDKKNIDYVSCQYNLHKIKMFTDAQNFEKDVDNGSSLNLSKNIYVGGTSSLSNYNGNIYSVRIYNRALTDLEVQQNYNMDKQRFEIE